MARARQFGVIAALTLLIAGCAAPATPAPPPAPRPKPSPTVSRPPTIVGTELPVVIDAATPPMLTEQQISQQEPGSTLDDGSLTDQVVADIRKSTLELTASPGTIAAACPSTMDWHAGVHDTCTASFDGVGMTWDVDITSDTDFVTYQLTPDTGILTARLAYAQFWNGYQHQSDQLRCDPIPPVSPVKVDAPTGYRCAYLAPVRDNTRTWTYIPVTVDELGDVQLDS